MRQEIRVVSVFSVGLCALVMAITPLHAQQKKSESIKKPVDPQIEVHLERAGELSATEAPISPIEERLSATSIVERSGYVSVQVNVASDGSNILQDAANEPSIVVDPTAPNRMVIGWRQFDTIADSFRQAGVAFSNDGGLTWTNNGPLQPGLFRSDPVLTADAEGTFYYYSLKSVQNYLTCDLFLSDDGGQTWSPPIPATGGDKAWTVVDQTGGIGHGNFYAAWSIAGGCCGNRVFSRSTDGGNTFMDPILVPGSPLWGTVAVGPDGTFYIVGNQGGVSMSTSILVRSTNAQDPAQTPTFEFKSLFLGGIQTAGTGPNPVGLLGQIWMDVDRSGGPRHGHIYIGCSVDPFDADPMDVHFVRSEDGGRTFSEPIKVNSPLPGIWQWFATMSVAPNGRIDMVWIESLVAGTPHVGELHYSSSLDGGDTWSTSVPISPSFNSRVGWPVQRKLGDYYHMVSDNLGADLAYAATFNGEQDVYYLRIGERDCNRNGAADSFEIEVGAASDCNGNEIPDSCELAAGTLHDENNDGIVDECQTVTGSPLRRVLGRH
ncbi:MAG: exo-alpha-sialidase [bacterium]|nr:exo-alpha-sialidase [bacterium]